MTCYHLLAGEPPFRGATAFDVALKHVQDQPRPHRRSAPDLPADLCGMVHKMMAKNPDERYQSAREILRDLIKVRDGVMVGLTQTNGAASHSPAGALSLSGTITNGIPTHGTLNTPVTSGPRWVFWSIAALGGVVALAARGAALIRIETAQRGNSRPVDPAPGGRPAGCSSSGQVRDQSRT